jgi:hypothetical protein
MTLSQHKGREGENVSIQRAWKFMGEDSEKYTKTDSSLVATSLSPQLIQLRVHGVRERQVKFRDSG